MKAMKRTFAAITAAIGLATGAFAETIDLSDPAVAIDVLTLTDGDIATGTLNWSTENPCMVTILDGATVTLRNVTIYGRDYTNCKWAGITCEGDATIILEGVNFVRGFYREYPGIQVYENQTLTIQGSGSLEATGSFYGTVTGSGAGIGGGGSRGLGVMNHCGNIVIKSGTITATGHGGAAGIGSGGQQTRCGNIIIEGGDVTATAQESEGAAGIGSGKGGSCGTVTIGPGIARVVAICDSDCDNPVGAGKDGSCGTVTVANTLDDKTSGNTRTIKARRVDLDEVVSETMLLDGTTVFGTLNGSSQPYKISIADGATVTVSNAVVNGAHSSSCKWAGLTCEGDATIIVAYGINSFRGFNEDYPGIFVPPGKTLTIKGESRLDASSNGYGAGIGGGYTFNGSVVDCGNIVIEGGIIHAYGGEYAAGIGGGYKSSCGSIEIKGGDVTADGGESAAAIGSGYSNASCGDIAITGGKVTATGGDGGGGAGIGSGQESSCGDITIGPGIEVVEASPCVGSDTPIGAGVYGTCGAVLVDKSLHDSYSYQYRTRTIEHWDDEDLSTLAQDCWIYDGTVVTGTLGGSHKITIDDGATVTLRDAVINGVDDEDFDWAGITCDGDATIILEGTNVVKGFYRDYPGIYVPEGHTLTIKGGGSLVASSNGRGAGIGGGMELECGNIVIDGGLVTAYGGDSAAGVGSGYGARCGFISIGPAALCVVATSGTGNPIGAGHQGGCGPVVVDSGMDDTTSGTRRTITRKNVNLAALGGDFTLVDGATATGRLCGPYKVSIADGATVTIRDVDINGDGQITGIICSGLTCLGNATIVLEGANTIRTLFSLCGGITVPPGSTLTIRGSGSLIAHGDSDAAGIGGGRLRNCGNIVIESGTITALGGSRAAGIGSAEHSECGSITILGGTVSATGGAGAPGIGSGCSFGTTYNGSTCGDISIRGGTVTATGGYEAPGIGSGSYGSSCGSVGISKNVVCVTAVKGNSAPYSVGSGKYGTIGIWGVSIGGKSGEVEESPFVYTGRGVDLTGQSGDYTARDGDIIVVGAAAGTVTIPGGATVTINGVTVTGAAGGTVLPAPTFAADGDAATTKFVQGENGKWTLTTFAEMSNDALGADVADGQIQVYAAPTVEGLDAASPMTSGVTVKEKKSAVKTVIEVTPSGNPPSQFFKVKFGE